MDKRIRALERQLLANPDIPMGVALIRARLGAKEITTGGVRGAAALGSSPAIAYLEKKPDMHSHSKTFYILLGYLALHTSEISEFLDKVIVGLTEDPDESERFFIDSNKIVEAFLAGQRKVDLSPHFIEPLPVKDAAKYYSRRNVNLDYQYFLQYFEPEAAGTISGTINPITSAYHLLLGALHTKTWVRIQKCLEQVVYARYWRNEGTYFPHYWDFEIPDEWGTHGSPPTREEQRQQLLDEHLSGLVRDISPKAINSLIGPYLSF